MDENKEQYETLKSYFNYSCCVLEFKNNRTKKYPSNTYFENICKKIKTINYSCIIWKDIHKNRHLLEYSISKLINKLQTIYNEKGFEGLTTKYLDKKYNTLYYNVIIIYKKKHNYKDKFNKFHNYSIIIPNEYCAYLLNILDDFKLYIKNKYPLYYAETYEEWLPHLKNILPELLSNNEIQGNYINNNTFSYNNYTIIMKQLKEFDKNVNNIRVDLKLYNSLPNGKYITFDNKLICDSLSETYLYNMIKLKSNDVVEIIREIKYYNIDNTISTITNLNNSNCDFLIINKTKNISLYCEVWGTKELIDNKYNKLDCDYIKRKNNKLKFWKLYNKQNQNNIFIGIYCNNCNMNWFNKNLKQYFNFDLTLNKDISMYYTYDIIEYYLNSIKNILIKYPDMVFIMSQIFLLSNWKLNPSIIRKIGGIDIIKSKINYTTPCYTKYYTILDIKNINDFTSKELNNFNKLITMGKETQIKFMEQNNNDINFKILPYRNLLTNYMLKNTILYFGHLDNFRKYLGENIEKSNKLCYDYYTNKKHIQREINKHTFETYKNKWIPIGIEYIQSCKDGDFIIPKTWSEWLINWINKNNYRQDKYCKEHYSSKRSYNPWRNKSADEGSTFINFIDDVIKYSIVNNLILPKIIYKTTNGYALSLDTYSKRIKRFNLIMNTHINIINNLKDNIINITIFCKLFINDLTGYTCVPYGGSYSTIELYGKSYGEFFDKTYEYAFKNNINIKQCKIIKNKKNV